LGGIYASDTELDYECLYCEQCGDVDWLIGQANTKEDTNIDSSGGRDYDYIQGFLKESFDEL